uniref:Short-chain collagen C4 n=1 Tax=Magallana gigas TaxID=29159 RepID=K1QSL2_MAGGI
MHKKCKVSLVVHGIIIKVQQLIFCVYQEIQSGGLIVMELMKAELLFMARNTKHTTLPVTYTHSMIMMYPVLFAFLEIDLSSKCFPKVNIDDFVARKTCYKGWKLEYHGYLMAGYYGHAAGSMYTCVDEHPDTLHGGHSSKDGRLFYSVEARCGSLKCPPYVEGRELVCAVCSKE